MPRRSQQDRSRSTRAALVATARRLFAERGYAHVPAAEIVTTAGITRGALYHHFADKQELFRAVFEELEGAVTAEIAAAIAAAPDRPTGLVVGLGRFLDVCQRPEVAQIALTDAPGVLGWQTWRQIEAQHGLGVITHNLQAAARDGQLVPAPVPVLALLGYAVAVGAAMAAFVHGYEEPTLHRQFGAQYQAYRRAVPAWWPRRRPWQPGQTDQP